MLRLQEQEPQTREQTQHKSQYGDRLLDGNSFKDNSCFRLEQVAAPVCAVAMETSMFTCVIENGVIRRPLFLWEKALWRTLRSLSQNEQCYTSVPDAGEMGTEVTAGTRPPPKPPGLQPLSWCQPRGGRLRSDSVPGHGAPSSD
ncbi:hypothetical protein AMECASPLE_022089 [Ameca splendens]|uniref:Uncharacterized protein n=1 Tax=Ameca splendens TaxID=208324 RepID=A0ABV0ZCK7_9TELE